MGAAEIIACVNMLLTQAKGWYDTAQQVKGDAPIPTWDEIVATNTLLQGKIDAEKV